MKIAHNFKKPNINFEKNKTQKTLNTLITNKRGGFLNLTSNTKSRYEGLFLTDSDFNVFKVIDDLLPKTKNTVTGLENHFSYLKRTRKELEEEFFIPRSFNSLVYKTSKEIDVEVLFDIKRIYENPEFGKRYKIYEEKDCIVIEFEQENDFRFFIAIKTTKKLDYKVLDEWIERDSSYDIERNSPPFKRFSYKGISLKGSEFVFSGGTNKNKTTDEAKEVFLKIEKLKAKEEKVTKKVLTDKTLQKLTDPYIKTAYACSINSLSSLVNFTKSKLEKRYRIYAGLPWFVRFWRRDEFISLYPVFTSKILTLPEIKVLLFDALREINEEGKMPNLDDYPPTFDATGWLFKRLYDLEVDKKLNFLERKEVLKFLKKTIKKLEESTTKEGLLRIDSKNTWMDTLKRSGTPIESQALFLLMYKFLFKLTKKDVYREKESELLEWVRLYYKKESVGNEKRPNIFLVHFIYPEMFKNDDWSNLFEEHAKDLWLLWGGFSTISKKSESFIGIHTGEKPQSYHNGDSWFFINNIAAISMSKIDNKKFANYIDKIIKASSKDILECEAIGHASEISSAKKFNPAGSPAQAWSASTYIELINEIFV